MGATHVTGEDEHGTRHATATTDAMKGSREAACGAALVRACATGARSETGDDLGVVVAEWPPFADRRCPECFTATGRPRVPARSPWRSQDRPS